MRFDRKLHTQEIISDQNFNFYPELSHSGFQSKISHFGQNFSEKKKDFSTIFRQFKIEKEQFSIILWPRRHYS